MKWNPFNWKLSIPCEFIMCHTSFRCGRLFDQAMLLRIMFFRLLLSVCSRRYFWFYFARRYSSSCWRHTCLLYHLKGLNCVHYDNWPSTHECRKNSFIYGLLFFLLRVALAHQCPVILVHPVLNISAKYRRNHALRGRWIQVGYKFRDFRPISGYMWETIQDRASYYGTVIGNHMRSIEPWHFRWHWVTIISVTYLLLLLWVCSLRAIRQV